MIGKKSIGEQLKEIRTSRNLTQQEFADLFNAVCPPDLATTRADIARYETGRNDVPGRKYVVFMSLAKSK